MFKPDLVKVAITAAGGRERIAEQFRISKQTVSMWSHTGRISAYYIDKLCALGDYIIKPEQLLAYTVLARMEKK